MPRSLLSALGVPTWPRLRLSRRLIRYSSVKCPVPWWSRWRDAAAFEAEHSQNRGTDDDSDNLSRRSGEQARPPGSGRAGTDGAPAGKVRIRVEACGVCRTDRHTVEGLHPGVRYPRVPGHEVV